ncbi:hypothetical protein LJR219_002389 [Phenylobacterium sp. LjRoot219]|uniref:hypothetical protein n=1 Tax=Phenylobacterium sp. LjRoot219 TaxID=3342283 RepID=UPI003ECD81E7
MPGAIIALIYDEAKKIWCYRWLAVVTSILLFLAAAAFILTRPNVYDAWGQIFVNKTPPVATAAQGVSLVGDGYGGAAVAARTALNDDSLERIIRKMDPSTAALPKEEMAKAVANLRMKIELKGDEDGFFDFHVKSTDPVYAQRVVHLLLTDFVGRNVNRNEGELRRAGEFLDKQIASYETMIAESKARIAAFQQRNPRFVAAMTLVGGSAGGGESADLTEARATYNTLLSQRPASAAGPSSERVAAVQSKLATLRSQYTDQHPDVVATKRELADAIAERNQAMRAGGGGDPQLASARARLLAAQRAAAGAALAPALSPALQAEWADLQRGDEVLRINYQQLVSKRHGTRVSEAVFGGDGGGKYQITRPPTVPELPIGPKRGLFLGLAAFGAIVAGLGVAYLRAAMVGIFVSRRELEQTFQLPVVGTVAWEPAWSTVEAARPGTFGAVRATMFRSWSRARLGSRSTSLRVS